MIKCMLKEWYLVCNDLQVKKNPSPSTAETSTSGVTAEEEEQILAEDDDELDLDELDELEASIAKTSLETNGNSANPIKDY